MSVLSFPKVNTIRFQLQQKMYPGNEFCRVCLQKVNNLTDLSNIDEDDVEPFNKKLTFCVPEMQIPNDTTVCYICDGCLHGLKSSFNFKVLCLQSNAILQDYESKQRSENQNKDETKENEVINNNIEFKYGEESSKSDVSVISNHDDVICIDDDDDDDDKGENADTESDEDCELKGNGAIDKEKCLEAMKRRINVHQFFWFVLFFIIFNLSRVVLFIM